MTTSPLLQINGLRMHFPVREGVLMRATAYNKAVDDVSLSISAGETLGLALGPGLYGLVLATGGYVASTGGPAQSPSALTAIAVGFTVVPAVLVALSLLPLRRYSLDERTSHV